jgi:hypothetical protein
LDWKEKMKAGEIARVSHRPLSAAEEQSVEGSSDIGLGSLISIEPASSGH